MLDNELIEPRPNRLPSALLIIGYLFASIFGFYGTIYLFAAGRFPFYIWTGFLLGIFSIYYGWFRTIRESSATKQLFKDTRQKIQGGAWAGIATAFLIYLATRSEGLNLSWLVPYLILSLVWAILLGIPAGGIGGLVLASIWGKNKAAYIGGAIAGAIFSSWWFLAMMAN